MRFIARSRAYIFRTLPDHNDYDDITAIQNDTYRRNTNAFLNEKIWLKGTLIDGVKFRRI